MWTRKGVVFLSGGILLMLLSLVFKKEQYSLMGIALLSYVLIVSLMRQFLQVAPAGKIDTEIPDRKDPDVTIEREMSVEYAFEDGDLAVLLKVRNHNKHRSVNLELFDTLPPEVKLKHGSNYMILNIKPDTEERYRYTITCPLMGPYEIGPTIVRYGDVSNMFFKEERIRAISDFLVLPKREDINHMKVFSKVPKLFAGAMSFKQPGEGSEFYALREYVPGDPFKNINWKAFSKTGTLMVNDHEWEAIHDVNILVDARAVSGIGFSDKNALIWGARAAASLADFFGAKRNMVGLVVYGDEEKGIFRLHPRNNEHHTMNMLSALAGAKPEGNMPLRSVADAILPHLTSRSPIVLISNLEEDESILDAVSYMCAMGFHLSVLSIPTSKIAFEAGKKTALEYSSYKLKHSILSTNISSYGARVVEWDMEAPLSAILEEVI